MVHGFTLFCGSYAGKIALKLITLIINKSQRQHQTLYCVSGSTGINLFPVNQSETILDVWNLLYAEEG